MAKAKRERKTVRERRLEAAEVALERRRQEAESELKRREDLVASRESGIAAANSALDARTREVHELLRAAGEAKVRIADADQRERDSKDRERVSSLVDLHLRSRELSWPLTRNRCLTGHPHDENPHAFCSPTSPVLSVDLRLTHAQLEVVHELHARGLHRATREETLQALLDEAIQRHAVPANPSLDLAAAALQSVDGNGRRIAEAVEKRTAQGDGVYPTS